MEWMKMIMMMKLIKIDLINFWKNKKIKNKKNQIIDLINNKNNDLL